MTEEGTDDVPNIFPLIYTTHILPQAQLITLTEITSFQFIFLLPNEELYLIVTKIQY